MAPCAAGLLAAGLLGLLAASMAAAVQELPGLTTIRPVLVDPDATGYGTFQSHNQKVVSNRRGIFMTHIRTRNEPYTAQQWRLSRSTDGGQSFTTIYEATHATNPPVLETDQDDNIYLMRVDFVDGNAYLYRFLADNDYRDPIVTTVPGGAAGKYSMACDRERRRLCYFAHNETFHIVSLDGTVLSRTHLIRSGRDACLQYPLLSLDPDGTLHAAWTSQKHGVYLYWDIHYMRSPDGGHRWETLHGAPLELPVVADQGGPSDRITRDDEFEAHTWLSSFMAKDGKVHFVYLAQTDPPREHYARCDLKTGARDVDIWPEFSGERISLRGLDGFFATRASLPGAPLYCVASAQGRIGCLASDDNGQTWYDYALSEDAYTTYSIGGCRELTADGFVIGSFTDRLASPQDTGGQSHVYFFKVQAGLSQARVIEAVEEGGRTQVRFADAHGQPTQVRFRAADGPWSTWRPFAAAVEIRIEGGRPTRYQLKSSVGVESPPCEM